MTQLPDKLRALMALAEKATGKAPFEFSDFLVSDKKGDVVANIPRWAEAWGPFIAAHHPGVARALCECAEALHTVEILYSGLFADDVRNQVRTALARLTEELNKP